MKKLLALALLSFAASAADLETKSYQVQITSHCDEGEVSCDEVVYQGKSKKSGKTIRLAGSSWHTLCADGVTPCRFLGYQFKNGDTTYYVRDDGLLQVIRGRQVLVSEQGEWRQ